MVRDGLSPASDRYSRPSSRPFGTALVGEAQDLVGIALERLAGFGQADAAAQSFEQELTEFTFEFADLLAERRLRHVARLPRPA